MKFQNIEDMNTWLHTNMTAMPANIAVSTDDDKEITVVLFMEDGESLTTGLTDYSDDHDLQALGQKIFSDAVVAWALRKRGAAETHESHN